MHTERRRENLTLTDAELAACRPVAGEGGHVLRARCPFHGSDHQRSLRVTRASGRFVSRAAPGVTSPKRANAGRTSDSATPHSGGLRRGTTTSRAYPRDSYQSPCHRRRVRLHQGVQRLQSSSQRSRRRWR